MPDANYKYLYYALRNAKIPNTGYNRHFKWVKELQFKYPGVDEQASIVEILDKVEKIISTRREELQTLDELIKARFVELTRSADTTQIRINKFRLVGKSCLIRNPKEEMAFGAFMSVIRTEYPYFLQGFFSSDYFKNQLTNVGTTSVNQITSKMLNNYNVIMPTKGQEEEFSVFCSQVDKSKVVIQKSLNETQTLFNSLMQEYFG